MEKLKILELFAGIGACSTALKRIGIDLKIVDAVEIDKYAMASFNAIHRTNFEVQDIVEYNKVFEDLDLITHGSPCQDFSVAGKQAGGDLGSGTRSSLMYETIRIVGQNRPKYVLWENVKNLLSAKHKHNFDKYIETMNTLGYNSYYQVLNAKDYGIPQNRERVYTISIRKDIDKGSFKFPQKEELKLRLKDLLEDKVEEKYYLKDYQIENIKKSTFMVNKRRIQEKDYCDTLCARDWKDPKCVQIGTLDIKGHDSIKRVYSKEGLSPTLTDMQGGNRQPKIITHNIPFLKEPKLEYLGSIKDKDIVGDGKQNLSRNASIGDRVYDSDGISTSITAIGGGIGGNSGLYKVDNKGLSPTIHTCQGGNAEPKVAVAMRGRYNASGKVEQQIEISSREIANSITTVQKDSMIGEGMRVRKDIKQEERYCKYCGKQLERKRFNGRLEDFTVFKNRKYCNRECMKRAYLKIGENNQTYSNAHTTARKINELILHKEVCELCGSDTNLDIHHIDGNWKNNNFDNLMCLCRSCHTKYERNKDKIRGEMPMDDRLRIRKLTPKECWRL